MADVLRLKGVFPPNRVGEYVISGEVYRANNLYINIQLWNPTAGVQPVYQTVGKQGWSRFTFTTEVDGNAYTGLIIRREDSGPNIAIQPGATSTTYFRNISAVRLVPAHVSTTDILNAGRLNHAYNGCKMTALDFNAPSPDTPDGGPVVEVSFVNPNTPTAAPADLEELDMSLQMARTGRRLVNAVPDPPIINDGLDPTQPVTGRLGRRLVNVSSDPIPIVQTDRLADPGRRLVNRSVYIDPTSGLPSYLTDRLIGNSGIRVEFARRFVNRVINPGTSTSTQERIGGRGRRLVN